MINVKNSPPIQPETLSLPERPRATLQAHAESSYPLNHEHALFVEQMRAILHKEAQNTAQVCSITTEFRFGVSVSDINLIQNIPGHNIRSGATEHSAISVCFHPDTDVPIQIRTHATPHCAAIVVHHLSFRLAEALSRELSAVVSIQRGCSWDAKKVLLRGGLILADDISAS